MLPLVMASKRGGAKRDRSKGEEEANVSESSKCRCGCGRDAEVDFAGLLYTRACLRAEIDGLRALGIPIEESEAGYRLAANVTIVDSGVGPPDRSKLH